MPSARERQPTARGLRIGQSRGSEKHAGVERREAYWSAAARDCGKARGKNHSHERDKGRRTCAPGMPAGHHGGKHLSGLDGFRVRGRCGVRVQRSHPTHTLSTASDGARARA